MTTFTKHGMARIRQRGLKESDVDFIMRNGTDTGDGYMVTEKDARNMIKKAKQLIAMAERLRNKRIVADGAEVLTAFHATRQQAHVLLHG